MSASRDTLLAKPAACGASLPDYIAARLCTPFAWGSHDCVTFAVGWLSLCAGRDLLAPYGSWRTEQEAARAIRRAGGLEAQFDAHLTRIEPNYGQDGDIALIGRTVFLFSGAHLVGPGEIGLVYRSRMEATCAWRP